jgi:Rap1a immunity proteins
MMNGMKMVVPLVISLLMATEARAQRTSQDLFDDCKSDKPEVQMSCVRFLEGIHGMTALFGALVQGIDPPTVKRSLAPFGDCAPGPVASAQLRWTFMGWADRHPSELGQPELDGALIALRERWPC